MIKKIKKWRENKNKNLTNTDNESSKYSRNSFHNPNHIGAEEYFTQFDIPKVQLNKVYTYKYNFPSGNNPLRIEKNNNWNHSNKFNNYFVDST